MQIWYVEVRISRIISESPLDFEITRVDCLFIYTYTKAYKYQIALVGGRGGGAQLLFVYEFLDPFFMTRTNYTVD